MKNGPERWPFFVKCGLANLMFVLPAQAAPTKSLVSAADYTHPHRQIEIAPGRSLDLYCVGHGSPTVLFVSGLGSQMNDWLLVQGPISQFTTACAYSRAGYLFSDPSPQPSDVRNAVSDLKLLVQKAPIPTPFVLVGHSIGGVYAALYADMYEQDVAGMVLADPAFAGQTKALTAGLSAADKGKFYASGNSTQEQLRRCLHEAQTGALAKPENAKSDCLDNPPDPDPAMHRALNDYFGRTGTILTLMSELDSATGSTTDDVSLNDRELAAFPFTFGAKPLVVLTAGDEQTSPDMTPAMIRVGAAGWKAGHDKLASASSQGVNITVPKSGHFIQKDQPEAVIRYVRQVVLAIRGDGHD